MDMKKFKEYKKRILIIAIAAVVCVGIAVGILLFKSTSQDDKYDEKNYVVKFFSDNEALLKIDNVKSGKSAAPPVEPEVTYGSVFQKWDTDFSSVSKDLEVYPVCESFKDKENVFALAGAYGKKEDTVTTSLSLCGVVELSGFDITVEYDKECLLLESVFDNDPNIILNDSEPGKIKINYVSTENTTADVDICSFKFKITDSQKENPLNIKVNKVYANKGNELYSPKYNVINSYIYIY